MTQSLPSKFSLDFLIDTARSAGEAILDVYQRDFEVETKSDDSPLTEADRRSHEVIDSALRERYPDIPILSEEAEASAYEARKSWDFFWLVDPLDGTKEFIKKNGEFTVNIALVRGGEPVAGVVYRPVGDIVYAGVAGEGAFKSEGAAGERVPLSGGSHYRDLDSIKVVASRSHLSDAVLKFVDDLKASGKEVDFLSAGSSLKLCLVAEGAADVYPRFGPTMEWDTGAAHAVANAAGRRVIEPESGEPLRYNKENLLNPWFIVE